MEQNQLLSAAISYVDRGLSIIPLHNIRGGKCSCGHADCGSPGKHPRTRTGLKEATLSKDLAQAWWEEWPDANIGIVTGKASGIMVIDVDGEEGEESLKMMEDEFYGPLPETWEQLTGGGGRHIIFKRPDIDKVGNRVKVAAGVDIRGDDGYIVAEPSNHISGRQYMWEAMHHPDETPLAAFPASWMDIYASAPRQFEPMSLPEIFGEGERNNLLFKLAASLRARGLSETALTAALLEENRTRCKPALPDREVEAIAHSVAKYPAGEIETYRRAVVGIPSPPVDETESLDTLRALLEKHACYTDEVVAFVENLDKTNHPVYFQALEAVRGAQGYRADEFKQARKRYKARQQGHLVLLNAQPDTGSIDEHLPDVPVKGLYMPGEWRLSGTGQIYKIEDKNNQPIKICACPHPVMPVMRLNNIDTRTEKLRVAFKRDKEWRDVVVDAATAANKSSIVQMANFGLQVTSESAKHLVTYLSEFSTTNKAVLPMRNSIARLGWVGPKSFAPYADDVVYDGELAYLDNFQAIHTQGEVVDWLKYVKSIRDASPVIRIVLAAAFASPVMALVGYQPFFIHLWGDSGAGKTAVQKLILSVWGNPQQLLKVLNTTKVGLERHAAFFHSLPMCLDELQALAKKYMSVDELIYTLALGKSKGRGTGSGGIEVEREWCNIIITSGEDPLSQDNSQGGARNRVLEFVFNKSDWPDVTDAAEATMFATDNYGHAGRMFIDALIQHTGGKEKPCKDLWQEFHAEIKDTEYTDKHINSVAMLAVGDYYSSRFVFGLDDAQARAEAMVMAMEIMQRVETAAQIDPIRQAWEFAKDWIEGNLYRFSDDYNGSMPRLGYLRGDEVLVIPSTFADALLNAGFNPKKSLRGFAQNKLLDMPNSSDGGKRFSSLKHVNGTKLRVYCFDYPLREFYPQAQALDP